ncbi:MAG: Sec-independent protein translocase subunit TatA/TatB [Planctomycetota bacterium]|jgi:sec-independent protein translocase protein TatA
MRFLLMFGMPGWSEILIIAFVGLLLFGRRLPEVGRSLGKSIVEFKRGVRDVEGELESASGPGRDRERILPPTEKPVAPPPPANEPATAAEKPEVPPAE